jgi:hypothetical protein
VSMVRGVLDGSGRPRMREVFTFGFDLRECGRVRGPLLLG